MKFKTLEDVDVKNKKILVRADFNVPLDDLGNIFDETRILKSLPTIKYLLDQNAEIILMSHLGRPEGKAVERLRLEPVGLRLSKLLDEQVLTLMDSVGPAVERAIEGMEFGDIILLENIRFHSEEEANDKNFAKRLANLADIFINDAFGTAHRAHASTEGVSHFLPSAAGLLMEEEVRALSSVIEKPKRPFVAVIGGAKISTKIKVINKLLEKVDNLLLGGALANTILKAAGLEVGKSLVEEEMMGEARRLSEQRSKKLKVPVDAVVAEEAKEDAQARIVTINEIQSKEAVYDIGPETIGEFTDIIKGAKTIIWNGPMGKFEVVQFAEGTNSVAKAVAESKGESIIGGGETLVAVSRLALTDRVSFVSTGGGAMLKFLEGSELPALEALRK
jgi:phosphoglycerate kinase